MEKIWRLEYRMSNERRILGESVGADSRSEQDHLVHEELMGFWYMPLGRVQGTGRRNQYC